MRLRTFALRSETEARHCTRHCRSHRTSTYVHCSKGTIVSRECQAVAERSATRVKNSAPRTLKRQKEPANPSSAQGAWPCFLNHSAFHAAVRAVHLPSPATRSFAATPVQGLRSYEYLPWVVSNGQFQRVEG